MTITLVFADLTGENLINQDRFSLSDPYVIISAPDGTELVRTEALRNEVELASWPGPFEASVDALAGEFRVALLDRDRLADDPMGHVMVQLPSVDGEHAMTDLGLRGQEGVEDSRLSFKVTITGAAPPAEPAPAPEPAPESTTPPQPTAPDAPPAPFAGNWWEAPLPAGVVVRKEIRKMPEDEQERVYNAYMKMRENKVDASGAPIKGSSEWCRLASYHGGFPGTPLEAYCSHGRENFPNWHRPYLIDFEQMLRRADMALGHDGMLGLPYWGWEEMEVNGQVLPAMIRRMCDAIDNETWGKMQNNDPTALDFYPGSWENRDGHYWLGYRTDRAGEFIRAPDDAALARLLDSANVVEEAERSLHMSLHRAHASSTYARGRAAVSIEQPHGTVHVHTGDVMRSHRSSFHPVFWMHHCNIDRFYQSYLEDEGFANSKREFERHQRRRRARPDPGYPDGPWGRLEPFHSNGGVPGATTEATMAPTRTMGYEFDSLPAKRTGNQMREAPWYAVFEQIRVATLERPCAVFVYVYDKSGGAAWTPPDAATDEELIAAPGFAGSGSIFFFALPDKPCENCQGRDPYDLRVDITRALRAANLHPKRAGLGVMVSDDGGRAVPIEQTKVPVPTIKGPRFFNQGAAIAPDADDDDDDALSAALGWLSRGIAKTADEIRAFQRAAGVTGEDGVFGPASKRKLTVGNLSNDVEGGKPPAGLRAKRGATVGWWLDADSVPSDLPIEGVEKELARAFEVWAAPSGLKFAQKANKKDAKVCIDFDDRSPKNDALFDGPGGALAEATSSAITFDECERWCLTGGGERKRAPFTWDDEEFELLTIAIHEIGHVLGLGHSDNVEDVMSPYYVRGRVTLTDNDVQRCMELMGGKAEGKKGGGGSSACDIL